MGNFFDEFRFVHARMEGQSQSENITPGLFSTLKDTTVEFLFRPSEFDLIDILGCEPSNSLTMFTYTVGTGFAESIKENIKLCSGSVIMVFSYDSSAKKQSVCRELVLLSKHVSSLQVFVRRNSHVKFFQRDNVALLGSQNFTTGADSYAKDEILVKVKEKGKELRDDLLALLSANDRTFLPVEVKGQTESSLMESLEQNLAAQQQNSRTYLTSIQTQMITPLIEFFQLDGLDWQEFSIDSVCEEKEEHLEIFVQALLESFKTPFDEQDIVDFAMDTFRNITRENEHFIAKIVTGLHIEEVASNLADQMLMENGRIDPETEEPLDYREQASALRVAKEQIYQENEENVISFMEEVNWSMNKELQNFFLDSN